MQTLFSFFSSIVCCRRFVIIFWLGSTAIGGHVAISEQEWGLIKPYLVDEKHPAKLILDRLFADPFSLQDRTHVEQNGFICLAYRSERKVIVARHKKLKGFLVKLFTEEQPIKNEWRNWIRRLKGAERIADLIEAGGYKALFKVPKKWVYLLPKGHRRSTILLVEDMKLLSREQNATAWKQGMRASTLEALQNLISAGGLSDSLYPSNLPFCSDGKIAFVDTEHYGNWPVEYARLAPFLSAPLEQHWRYLWGEKECD